MIIFRYLVMIIQIFILNIEDIHECEFGMYHLFDTISLPSTKSPLVSKWWIKGWYQNYSERSVCAALGHCSQNVLATIKVFSSSSLSSFHPVTFLQEKVVLKYCVSSQVTKIKFSSVVFQSLENILYLFIFSQILKMLSIYHI